MSAKLIAEEILNGRKLLLWIGAGNSCSAGIPPDADDEGGLAFRLALVHFANDRQRIANELGPRFRLAELAALIGKSRVKDLILQQGWMDVGLSDAHRAIAALVKEGFRIEVVTVNFDPLLERGLLADEIHTEVVYSATSCGKLAEEASFVIKVHGCPFRDSDPNHLLMLAGDLAAPPAWVTTFLNDRLLERVFVYVGFSGNAEYVRRCVTLATEALHGDLRQAYAVDVYSAETVFAEGNQLGEFYASSSVPPANYSSEGADHLFRSVADLVFGRIMLLALARAADEARRHGCHDFGWLNELINNLTYSQARSFGGRLGILRAGTGVRLRDVAIEEVFKWILILAFRNIISAVGFKPVLAYPYRPSPENTASAPVIFIDGFKMEAAVCRAEILELMEKKDFKLSFQVAAEPRWYVVIVNCKGNIPLGDMRIIEREPESIVRGYDPTIFIDENTMVTRVADLEGLFR